MAISKKMRAARELINAGKYYVVAEALDLVKKAAKAKFDEAVDIAVNLGIDPRKSDQAVRGAVVLPNGTGRSVKVAVFAQGANADAARAAGADTVGFEDLAEAMKAGDLNYDVVIASPDAMRIVGQLGQVLGPRGLMPNPKVGTVAADVGAAVKNAKGGQVRYRSDKGGVVHCTIGKASFSVEHLQQNLQALLADLKKVRPTTMKGIFIKKVTLSSTMGPGVLVEQASLNEA